MKKFVMIKSVAVLALLLLLAACGPATPPADLPPTEPADPVEAEPVDPLTEAELDVADELGISVPDMSDIPQWSEPPEMMIDPDKVYVATFRTEKGDIVVELFANRAPKTVNNLYFLAGEGFYDDTTFHRVLDGFMAQGGDPTGTGMGGPGYQFEDEIIGNLTFDEPGLLAMANAGPGTNGSQFFITFEPAPWLDGRHTIFGKVIEGMDVLDSLTRRDPMQTPEIEGDRLETVIVEEVAASVLPPPPPTPVPRVPALAERRLLAELPFSARVNIFDRPPNMVIDPDLEYVAIVETTLGEIVFELYAAAAPESVNNFYVLANLGYWDDFPIIYVEPEIFALTGSPEGRPDTDIGYSLPMETGQPAVFGALGYFPDASQTRSSGSQILFLLGDLPELEGVFTIFGQAIEGEEFLRLLSIEEDILSITVEER